MGSHTTIQSLLNARLAGVSPALPISYENVDFSTPKPTDTPLPQISVVSFQPRTPSITDVYTLMVGGVAHTASGASVAAIMATLAAGIVGAVVENSPPTLTITGSNGVPFSLTALAATGGGVDITDACYTSPAVTNDQEAYISNAWLRAFLLEGRPRAAGLGTQAFNEHVGVFQIDVNFPAGAGWGACKDMADTLCSLFPRGLVLAEGTTRVIIGASGPGPAYQDGHWFTLPVSIFYTAYAAND